MVATPVAPSIIPHVEAPASLPTLAAEIMTAHHQISGSSKGALQNAMHAGDLLREAKAQLPHGQWLGWLAANCDVSIRNVQVYMELSRARSRLEEVLNTHADAHLDITVALTLLRAPNFAEAVRRLLAKTDEDDEIAEDQDENDLGPGGHGGTGKGTGKGTETETGNGPGSHTQSVHFFFSVDALAQFRQQVKDLAAHFAISTTKEPDRLCAVIAQAHAALVRRREDQKSWRRSA